MKHQELHEAGHALHGPAYPKIPRAAQQRRGLRALHAGGWVCVLTLCAVALLTGCDYYNPYLGASATFSSTISLITPSSRNAGCSGFTLDIQGGGFTNGTIVLWNGQQRTTIYESSTELLATINAADLATPGNASVAVSVPGQIQGNDLSNIVYFTIGPVIPANQCPLPPVFAPNISGLNPNSGATGTSVTITGTYFGGVQGTSTISFGTAAATIATATDWSATNIITTVPSGLTPGPVPVVINVNGLTNPNEVLFTVIPAQTSSSAVILSRAASSAPLYAGVGNPVSVGSGTRYVAYVATSSDPTTAGDEGVAKIYLRDTCRGAIGSCTPYTILVSTGLDGSPPNGPSGAPSVSADGRFVAFASEASNLVPSDDNGITDVFVRDTCIGAGSGCLPSTARISLGPAGLEANGASTNPSISADGRFIAFTSSATNLTLDTGASLAESSQRTFLRDTCFGASGACTPSTSRMPVPSAAQ